MILDHAFATHVGCCRNENQDNFAELAPHHVFAVADGMGGHVGGAQASELAVKAFAWQADHDAGNLSGYIEQAHELVTRGNQERGAKPHGLDGSVNHLMGTTGVIIHVLPERGQYAVAWCGDSRLYHFGEGRLEQVTRDHSEVQQMMDRGLITAEAAANYPRRNVLIRAIGVGPLEQVDVRRRPLKEGDILVLCTDGISNEVPDVRLQQLCDQARRSHWPARQLAQTILAEALDGGGRDNATVGIVMANEEIF